MTAAFLHLTSSVARIYNGNIFAMNKHALLTALPRTCPREQPLGSVSPSCAVRCDAHVDVDFMAVLLLRSGRSHRSTHYTTEVTRKLIKSWILGKVLNVSVMLPGKSRCTKSYIGIHLWLLTAAVRCTRRPHASHSERGSTSRAVVDCEE